MRSYTCRTCKEHSWQLLQREIGRRLELEVDTTLHNTSFARQAETPSCSRMSDPYSQLGIGRATA
jgi:hypothetical protein